MTFLVLFILAVVWAVYLVSWVRGKSSGRRVNSIHSFSSHLSILERTAADEPSAVPVAPRTAPLLDGQYFAPRKAQLSPQKKRRRDVLLGLLGATGVTFLGAFGLGSSFMMLLFLLSAAATGAYVYQLVQLRKRTEERTRKVHRLDARFDVSSSGRPNVATSVDRGAVSVGTIDGSDLDAPVVVREPSDVDDVLGAVFGDLDGGSARAVGH